MGGHLKLSKRHSYKLDLKVADSLAFAPQKTLGTGLQCAVFLVKDKDLLMSTNSSKADYLIGWLEILYPINYRNACGLEEKIKPSKPIPKISCQNSNFKALKLS